MYKRLIGAIIALAVILIPLVGTQSAAAASSTGFVKLSKYSTASSLLVCYNRSNGKCAGPYQIIHRGETTTCRRDNGTRGCGGYVIVRGQYVMGKKGGRTYGPRDFSIPKCWYGCTKTATVYKKK